MTKQKFLWLSFAIGVAFFILAGIDAVVMHAQDYSGLSPLGKVFFWFFMIVLGAISIVQFFYPWFMKFINLFK